MYPALVCPFGSRFCNLPIALLEISVKIALNTNKPLEKIGKGPGGPPVALLRLPVRVFARRVYGRSGFRQ